MKKIFFITSVLLITSLFCGAQSILSVSPSSASAGQTLNVTITGSGTHFLSGSGTHVDFGFFQCSNTVNFLTVNNDVSLTANITIPSPLTNSFQDVEVFNLMDGYLEGDHMLELTGGSNYVAAMTPNYGAAGQTLNVSITGTNTHFTQNSGTVNVWIDFNERLCVSTNVLAAANVVNDTYLTTSFTIPPGTPQGYYDMSVMGTPDYNLYQMFNSFHVTGNTSIEEPENITEVGVMPNPISGRFSLSYTLAASENVNIYFNDLLGRNIWTRQEGKQPAGKHDLQVDPAIIGMSDGIYFLKLAVGKATVTRKIVISKDSGF
jgi:hypothetical protein